MLLTTPFPTSRLPRHESVFVLVLMLALLLAIATFFVPFAIGALAAGALLSILLHRSAGTGPADESSAAVRLVGINFASIHIGGDAGGLIFVLGSLAIVMLGLPTLTWFLVASLVAAGALAATLIALRS